MTEVEWQEGPLSCKLGNNIAKVEIDGNYLFLDGRNTRNFMKNIGNPTSGTELGTILPGYEGADDWFILFEYDKYVVKYKQICVIGRINATSKGCVSIRTIRSKS